jgi:hypothetical protein
MENTQKHIRKEELSEYNYLSREIRELARTIGMVRLSEATYVANLSVLNEKYNKFIDKVERKYGKDIQINTETGEINRKEA